MTELLPKLILVGLGAAVSPIAITVLISVMLKKHPVRNALLFLLSYTMVLIAIGIAWLLLLHLGGHVKKTPVDGYIDIALGVLCLLMIPLAWKRRRKQGEPETHEMKGAAAFTLGGASMLVNFTTIPIYVSGLHMISSAKLPLFDDLLAMMVLTLVTLLTLIIPIVIYSTFPKTAEGALSSLSDWLNRNQRVIGVAILLIFGVFLLIKGIRVVA
jgi:hypothetical protein